LTGNTTLTGTTVQNVSTIAGGGFNLAIIGNAVVTGAITGVTNYSVNGTSNLNANVTTTGTQIYTGAVTQSVASTLDAGASTILIDANDGAISLAGALKTTNATATAVQIIDASTVALGNITTGGAGTVVLGGAAGDSLSGVVTQSGIINAGTLIGNTGSTVTLGGNNTLINLGTFTSSGNFSLNDLGGLALTGSLATGTGSATVTTTGLLALGTNSITTTGALGNVSLTGVGVTSTAGTVNAGAGSIMVNAGGSAIQLNTSTLTTTNSSATAVDLQNATTVALGNVTAASGTLRIGTGNVTGAVTQTAATLLDVSTLIGGTTNTVTLMNSNTIANLGAFTTNGAFTLNDTTGGLNVTGAVTTTNNGLASMTTTGGNLAVTTGSIAGAGVTLVTTGANDITLAGNVDGNAGPLTLTSGRTISQTTGAVKTTGTSILTAMTGDIDLNNPANDFGGAVTVVSSVNLNIDDINSLTLSTVNASGNAQFDAAGNIDFTGVTTIGGNLTANSIANTQANGGPGANIFGADITNTGAGQLLITGTSRLKAGTGDILLANLGNEFSRLTVESANNVGIRDSADGLTLFGSNSFTGSFFTIVTKSSSGTDFLGFDPLTRITGPGGASEVHLVAGEVSGASGVNEIQTLGNLKISGSKFYIYTNSLNSTTGSNLEGITPKTINFGFAFTPGVVNDLLTNPALVAPASINGTLAGNVVNFFAARPIIDTGAADVASLLRSFLSDFIDSANTTFVAPGALLAFKPGIRDGAGYLDNFYGPFSVSRYEHAWWDKETSGEIKEDQMLYKRRYPIYLYQTGSDPTGRPMFSSILQGE
jgi:hypothetical protein